MSEGWRHGVAPQVARPEGSRPWHGAHWGAVVRRGGRIEPQRTRSILADSPSRLDLRVRRAAS
eukprot:4152476-Alexandrium_andersonii.AAC.1